MSKEFPLIDRYKDSMELNGNHYDSFEINEEIRIPEDIVGDEIHENLLNAYAKNVGFDKEEIKKDFEKAEETGVDLDKKYPVLHIKKRSNPGIHYSNLSVNALFSEENSKEENMKIEELERKMRDEVRYHYKDLEDDLNWETDKQFSNLTRAGGDIDALGEDYFEANLKEEHLTDSRKEFEEKVKTNYDFTAEVEVFSEYHIERELTASEEEEFKYEFQEYLVDEFDNAKSYYIERETWEEVSWNVDDIAEEITDPDFYKENSDRLNWEGVSRTHRITEEIYLDNSHFLEDYKENFKDNPYMSERDRERLEEAIKKFESLEEEERKDDLSY